MATYHRIGPNGEIICGDDDGFIRISSSWAVVSNEEAPVGGVLFQTNYYRMLLQGGYKMQKNTAGKWVVFAWTTADNLPKTGDALNITANIRIDGGIANAVDDTNPTELEDGYYIFDITAAEANGDNLVLCPASSTSGVQVIGVPGAIWTSPPNFEKLSIDASGKVVTPDTQKVDVNTIKTQSITCGAGVTVLASVGTAATSTAQTGDTYALANGASGFAAIKGETASILDDTGTNGVVVAAASKTGYALSATQTFNLTGDITGSLSGSVGSVTGLTPANLDVAVSTRLATAGYTAPLDAAGTRTAVGLAAANLDTQLTDIPTVAEFEARTLVAANYGTAANQTTIAGYIDTEMAAALAAVDTEVAAIKTVTDSLTAAAAAKLALSAGTIVSASAITGTLSTTQMSTDLTEATDDHYNGRIVIFTSGVLANQATDITAYNGTTKVITMTALTEAPSNADTFVIV